LHKKITGSASGRGLHERNVKEYTAKHVLLCASCIYPNKSYTDTVYEGATRDVCYCRLRSLNRHSFIALAARRHLSSSQTFRDPRKVACAKTCRL